MTSKPQQPRNPLSGFYFKLHFWNQRVTLIKMNWRVRYLFDFDLEIPSAHVCFMLDLFEIKDEDFCSIVQRWTLLPAPSLLLFQSRQTKSWNCVTFKAFPAFQRVLVACGAACDVRRGVRSCEAPTSKSDGRKPRRAAARRRAILSFTPCSTSCTSTYIGELWVLHLNKKTYYLSTTETCWTRYKCTYFEKM